MCLFYYEPCSTYEHIVYVMQNVYMERSGTKRNKMEINVGWIWRSECEAHVIVVCVCVRVAILSAKRNAEQESI